MSNALTGEGGAYVPCDELPSPFPADPDGALVGSSGAFVSKDMLAASHPTDPDGALVGSSGGFVAKPCDCEPCNLDDFDRIVASGFGETSCDARAWSEQRLGDTTEVSASVNGSEGLLVIAPTHAAGLFFGGPSWQYDHSSFIVESLAGGGPWATDAWTMTARVFIPDPPPLTILGFEVFASTKLTLFVSRPFGNGWLEMSVSNHADTLAYLGLRAGANYVTLPLWTPTPGWNDVTWIHRSGGGNIDEATVGASYISVTSAGAGAFAAHFAGFDIEVNTNINSAGTGTPPDPFPLDPMTWKVDCINFE